MRPKGNKNIISINDEHATIKVKYKGVEYDVLISLESIEKVKNFDYTFSLVKKSNGLYAAANIYEKRKSIKRVYLHRFILDFNGDEYVDHINGNPLDNRLTNLRIVKPYQNSQNRRGAASNNNTSGVRGVYWQGNRWRARMMVQGRRRDIGYFDKIEDAVEALEKERIKFWDTLS